MSQAFLSWITSQQNTILKKLFVMIQFRWKLNSRNSSHRHVNAFSPTVRLDSCKMPIRYQYNFDSFWMGMRYRRAQWLWYIFLLEKRILLWKLDYRHTVSRAHSSTFIVLYQMTTIQHFRYSIVMLCRRRQPYSHSHISEFQVESNRNETNVHFTIFNTAINSRYHPRCLALWHNNMKETNGTSGNKNELWFFAFFLRIWTSERACVCVCIQMVFEPLKIFYMVASAKTVSILTRAFCTFIIIVLQCIFFSDSKRMRWLVRGK